MAVSQRRRQLLARRNVSFMALRKRVGAAAIGILLVSPRGRQLLLTIRRGSTQTFRYLVRVSLLLVFRSATRSFHVLRTACQFIYATVFQPSPTTLSPPPSVQHPVLLRQNPALTENSTGNTLPQLPSDVADKILSGISGFSFEACSWFMFYHIGVARALVDGLGKDRLAVCSNSGNSFHKPTTMIGFGGSSSGSLVAAALALGLDLVEFETFAFGMVDDYAEAFWGPVGFMSKIVRGGLERLVGEGEEHSVDLVNQCDGRLVVSITSLRDLIPTNRIVTGRALGRTNQELFTTLLSSCYIPVYYEDPPVFLDNGTHAIGLDGGASNLCPPIAAPTLRSSNRSSPGHQAEDRTVRVSPYKRLRRVEPYQIASQCSRPAYPTHLAIAPTCRHDYEELLRDGYEDACTWIQEQVSKYESRGDAIGKRKCNGATTLGIVT